VPKNCILIDLENIQPKNLHILREHAFKIYVFVGENQTKISFELAATLQEFGADGKYIKVSGNGKNALDFHLAFYLGQLSKDHPKAYLHIISKDTGFDPLVKHLRQNNIKIFRHTDLAEIPLLRISNSKNIDEKIEAVVKNLASRGSSRPRKVSTLSSTINSLFSEKMTTQQMTAFINTLKSKKYIIVKDDSVSYNLPKSP
jgi:hypothetical protein